MRPLLIFLNCFERLNLAFTEYSFLFFETFLLMGNNLSLFVCKNKCFLEAMQQK